MSKNGASSYAGSLDFESYIPSNQNIIVYYGMGSYNSSRLSWQIEDLLFKKVRFYIQASSISTDGYKYHSGNKSNSVFFVSDYSYKKNRFKLVAFIGSSTNKLAWIGAPMDSIKKDNRYNSCTTGENDDFIQNHIQFHHTYLFDSKNKINYCVYYNYIKGGYTFDYPNFLNQNNDNSVEKSNTYINKYDVVENFTGFYVNYSKNTEYLTWLIGFNSYDYNCKHIGSAQQLNQLSNLWGPDNTSNYTNIGFRDEKSLYTKIILKLDNLHVYGDIQYRHSTFTYQGQDITKYYRWNFLNHSYGVDFSKNNYKIYYNIGKSYREPCRNDLFNGYDNPTISDIVDLKPESVIDQELGYKYNSKKLYLNFNLYFMNFKDELTLTGQTGPGGYPLHENVDKSYRKGIELDMKYKFNNGLFLSNSSCLNRSVIEQKGIDIVQVLTPSTIVNQEIGVDKKYFTIGLIFRYQSFSYIDFENTKDYELPEYKTINLRFGIKYKSVEWSLYLNNITSEKYFNMGNVGGNRPVYFANAPINFFTGVKIRLR